jgi:hypothetical protein
MPTRNATRSIPGRRKGTPKTGGRKKGTPNRVTVEARRAASAMVDDPAYRKRLVKDMRARKVAPAIEQMLWYYAKGKPVEQVTGTFDLRSTIVDPEKSKDLTEEELRQGIQLFRKMAGAPLAAEESDAD